MSKDAPIFQTINVFFSPDEKVIKYFYDLIRREMISHSFSV